MRASTRSGRRGWNMTEHVRFLGQLPVRAMLDRELVAFGADGKPDFERVCERMLRLHAEIPLTFLAFDVLSLEGRDFRARATAPLSPHKPNGRRSARVPPRTCKNPVLEDASPHPSVEDRLVPRVPLAKVLRLASELRVFAE